MNELVDTHCHIHFPDYELDTEEVISNAREAGVTKLICVGCTLEDSKLAVELASKHDDVWASIGLHPHEAKHYVRDSLALQKFKNLAIDHSQISRLDEVQGDCEERSKSYKKYGERAPELATQQFAKSINGVGNSVGKQVDTSRKVVAIGECGLDYYYQHSPKADQNKLLRYQIELALEHDLPLIFHIREAPNQDKSASHRAFDDFFATMDQYKGIRGVVHSFTANVPVLDKVLSRGLNIGLNGIITFAKDEETLKMAKTVPLDKLLLETDAPFLTPAPFRGKVCEPKHVRVTAEFLSKLREESLEQLCMATTQNAKELFNVT